MAAGKERDCRGMIVSQGSYHRNSVEGEWNYPIDANAGPDGKGDDYIDWKMWLGRAEASSDPVDIKASVPRN